MKSRFFSFWWLLSEDRSNSRSNTIDLDFLFEQSAWEPTTNLIWFSIEVYTFMWTITLPTLHSEFMLTTLQRVISKFPDTSTQKLSRFCGKLVSTKFVLGNIVQLKTRQLYDVIALQ